MLGRSNGQASQEWYFGFRRLERRPGEVLEVERRTALSSQWEEVPDFRRSGPEDRHYTLDSLSGVLRLGHDQGRGRREMQYGAIRAGDAAALHAIPDGRRHEGNVAELHQRAQVVIPYVRRSRTPARYRWGGRGDYRDGDDTRPQVLRARLAPYHRRLRLPGDAGHARSVTRPVRAAHAPDIASGKTTVKLILVPESNQGHAHPPNELRLGDRARSK